MKPRAILFDLGGTLLHYHDPQTDEGERHFRRITQVGVMRVVQQIAADGGPLLESDVLTPVLDKHIGQAVQTSMQDLRGSTVEQPIRAALEESGVPLDAQRWALLRPYFYEAIDTIVSPRLGIVETLTTLKESGYALGLISNTLWAADLHDRHLTEFGLINLLPVRVYSCDTEHVKPHPTIFQTALSLLGVEAHDAVYVGDRPDLDVAGAQGAGMRGILIRSPYLTDSFDGAKPDAVISEIPELLPTLESWEAS